MATRSAAADRARVTHSGAFQERREPTTVSRPRYMPSLAAPGPAGRAVKAVRHLLRRAARSDSYERALAGGFLEVGAHTYGRPRVLLYPGDTGRVAVGTYCSIANDVEFIPGGIHPTDWVSTYPHRIRQGLPGAFTDGCPSSKGDILVGHDVWIGAGAKILSGVRIGHGSVVGAYAVVARDVRPYAVVVGSPAREVRRRFTDEQVDALLRIAWWDWPAEEVGERAALLSSSDVDSFIRAFAPPARDSS